MFKNIVFIISIFVFALIFSANPAQAKGNSGGGANLHGNPHQNIVLDEPDEGDNEHPSGKARSVEPGNSGTQGDSNSDPDDDERGPDRTNGGPDKQPDGVGGIDRDDQDNNNGCGNDDDFEDDNEGWCGAKPKGGPGDGDDGDGDSGNDNGDENNGDDQNGNGGMNGDGKDEQEQPYPEQPKLKEKEQGEVLGATTLPVTGEDNKAEISIILSLILGGITTQAINKRLSLRKPR